MTFRTIVIAILMFKSLEVLSVRATLIGMSFSQNTGTFLFFILCWLIFWAFVWHLTAMIFERKVR